MALGQSIWHSSVRKRGLLETKPNALQVDPPGSAVNPLPTNAVVPPPTPLLTLPPDQDIGEDFARILAEVKTVCSSKFFSCFFGFSVSLKWLCLYAFYYTLIFFSHSL